MAARHPRAAEALQGLGTTVKGAGEKIKEGVGGALEGILGGKKKDKEKSE